MVEFDGGEVDELIWFVVDVGGIVAVSPFKFDNIWSLLWLLLALSDDWDVWEVNIIVVDNGDSCFLLLLLVPFVNDWFEELMNDGFCWCNTDAADDDGGVSWYRDGSGGGGSDCCPGPDVGCVDVGPCAG